MQLKEPIRNELRKIQEEKTFKLYMSKNTSGKMNDVG